MATARWGDNSQVAWLCTYFPPKVIRIHSIMPHIIIDFWDLGIPTILIPIKVSILSNRSLPSPLSPFSVPWNSCSTMNKLSHIIRLFKGFCLLPDLTETGPSPCNPLKWRLLFVSGVHTWQPELELVVSWPLTDVPKPLLPSLLQNPTPLLLWNLCHLAMYPCPLPTATTCNGHRWISPSFSGL